MIVDFCLGRGLNRLPNQSDGAQFFRVETRYLDPDVNAFVGMLTTLTRFNQVLIQPDPISPNSGLFVWNWGADIGIVRGAHLWELDLMGVSLGERLAFGPAIAGEHTLFKPLKFYHRTMIDMFVGSTLLDSNQGLEWFPWQSVGLTLGYRIFAAKKMLNRDGPCASLIWRFQNPKIPFLFPSMG